MSAPAASPALPAALVHAAWLRLCHWANALAVVLMMASGWRIYNASPLFGFTFPPGWTLGGWLGGALQWHFAAMWLLVANGLVYLAAGIAGGGLRRRLLPLSPAGLGSDLRAALRGRLQHPQAGRYNQLQRAAYLFALAVLAALAMSGLVLWKPVQFELLRGLLGGYEAARRVHFFAMAALLAFVLGHAALALLVPRTLVAMVRGR